MFLVWDASLTKQLRVYKHSLRNSYSEKQMKSNNVTNLLLSLPFCRISLSIPFFLFYCSFLCFSHRSPSSSRLSFPRSTVLSLSRFLTSLLYRNPYHLSPSLSLYLFFYRTLLFFPIHISSRCYFLLSFTSLFLSLLSLFLLP